MDSSIDFDRLKARGRQFGGCKLAWEYTKLGLAWVIAKQTTKCIVGRRSFKAIYPSILAKVEPMLVEKYLNASDANGVSYPLVEDDSEPKTRIWWCWLQGYDTAPDLAKVCLSSLKQLNTEVVIIDKNNYRDWVRLPYFIVEKYHKGIIPQALMSDLLRLELLLQYGGVWIDSTVLCTGRESAKFSPSWDAICEAELFVFQYTRPDERWTGNIGNWFIASKRGNPLLLELRNALYRYWSENNCVLDYYIFHLFFAELAKRYPNLIKSMPYGWAAPCLQLRNRLNKEYNEDVWLKIQTHTSWHKISSRIQANVVADKDNFYNKILESQI